MNCAACRAELAAHLDEPRLAVSRHLQGCPTCRRSFDQLRAALDLLAAEARPPAPDLRADVWRAIASETGTPVPRRVPVALIAAAVLLILASPWLLPLAVWRETAGGYLLIVWQSLTGAAAVVPAVLEAHLPLPALDATTLQPRSWPTPPFAGWLAAAAAVGWLLLELRLVRLLPAGFVASSRAGHSE